MKRYENETEQYKDAPEHTLEISLKPTPKQGLTGVMLKSIALITMVIDHIGAAVLLFFTSYYVGKGQYTPVIDVVYQAFRWVGRISFPIYCFLLVEGFLHTSNTKKYLARLFVFALISEIPFNLAFSDSLWQTDSRNVFFTLFLGMLAMTAWQWITERGERFGDFRFLVAVSAVAVCVAVAYCIKCDYDMAGICLILIFYFWRDRRGLACLIGYLCMIYEPQCLPAFLLIMAYNGEKGVSKRSKYFFYSFYPQHLCYLYIIRLIVLSI